MASLLSLSIFTLCATIISCLSLSSESNFDLEVRAVGELIEETLDELVGEVARSNGNNNGNCVGNCFGNQSGNRNGNDNKGGGNGGGNGNNNGNCFGNCFGNASGNGNGNGNSNTGSERVPGGSNGGSSLSCEAGGFVYRVEPGSGCNKINRSGFGLSLASPCNIGTVFDLDICNCNHKFMVNAATCRSFQSG